MPPTPASLAGRQSAGAQGSALCPQGQAGALPVHGRGAQPSGAVRQQAAAREVRRHAAARRADQGLSRRVHQARAPSCSGPSSSSPGTARAGPSSRSCLPHLATVVDDIAVVKGDGHRRVQPRARPDHDEHRLADLRPAEHGGLGHATAWGASRRTCPASSSSARARRGPAAAIPTGAAASCPPSTRASSSAPAATRCLYLSNPRGIDADLQRDSLDAVSKLNQLRLERVGRSRDRHADQLVRDGLPHAALAPRT